MSDPVSRENSAQGLRARTSLALVLWVAANLALSACSSDNTGSSGNPSAGASSSGAAGSAGATPAGGSSSGGASSAGAPSGGSGGVGGTPIANGGSLGTAGSASGGTGASGAAGAPTGGAGGVGGTAGTGGQAGSGGSAGGVSSTGTATRPQLSAASAADFTPLKYLAQAGTLGQLKVDNWDPTAGLAAASSFTPTYTVASDGSGNYTTVQAAIDAVTAAPAAARAYILVKPGTYTEVVCVKASTPITLYGANDADATKVVITNANYATKAYDTNYNPCKPPSAGATTYGTSASATFAVNAAGFQAKNLTISNTYGEGSQAVALLFQGDQEVLDNVRLLGHQDTFYVGTTATTVVARAFVKSSYIEGDVDFIFGRGTLVVTGSTLNYLAVKPETSLAPSTAPTNPYGMLIVNSAITAQTGTAAGVGHLGRAWDESVKTPPGYVAGTSPNGQAVIRETTVAAFINVASPWAPAATTSRPFNATMNRLYEYANTGPGAAP
jgi:pectinesterase